jgi:hypothetical protein
VRGLILFLVRSILFLMKWDLRRAEAAALVPLLLAVILSLNIPFSFFNSNVLLAPPSSRALRPK